MGIPAAETLDGARSRLRRWQIVILATLCVVYVGVLINRRGISATAPTMVNDTRINYTKSDLGALLATGNAAHLVAELFSGAITDRVGGRIVFMVSGMGPAVATLLFSFGRTMPVWALCWVVNRVFQAAVYPSMTKLVSAWFPPSEYGRAVGILSSSSRAGAMIAAAGMGSLMLKFGLAWDQVLLIAAIMLAVLSFISWFVVRSSPARVGLSLHILDASEAAAAAALARARDGDAADVKRLLDDDGVAAAGDSEPASASGSAGDLSSAVAPRSAAASVPPPVPPLPVRLRAALAHIGGALRRFAREPRFWLICWALGCLWCLFEMDAYVPTFLADALDVSPALSAIGGAAFPAGMVISTTGGGFLLDRLGRRRGNLLIFLSLCLTLLTIALFALLTAVQRMSVPLAVVLAFLYGLTLGLPAYMPHSLFALRFGGDDCATLLAVIDVFGWGFIIVFDLASSRLTVTGGQTGWTPLFGTLLVVAVAATILLGAFLYLDTRAAEREQLVAGAAVSATDDDRAVTGADGERGGAGGSPTPVVSAVTIVPAPVGRLSLDGTLGGALGAVPDSRRSSFARSSFELRALSGAGNEGT